MMKRIATVIIASILWMSPIVHSQTIWGDMTEAEKSAFVFGLHQGATTIILDLIQEMIKTPEYNEEVTTLVKKYTEMIPQFKNTEAAELRLENFFTDLTIYINENDSSFDYLPAEIFYDFLLSTN